MLNIIPFEKVHPVLTKLFLRLSINKYQLDALFILSLFGQSTTTCFGHICNPSSGGN